MALIGSNTTVNSCLGFFVPLLTLSKDSTKCIIKTYFIIHTLVLIQIGKKQVEAAMRNYAASLQAEVYQLRGMLKVGWVRMPVFGSNFFGI